MVCGGYAVAVFDVVCGHEYLYLAWKGTEREKSKIFASPSDGVYFLGPGGIQWLVH